MDGYFHSALQNFTKTRSNIAASSKKSGNIPQQCGNSLTDVRRIGPEASRKLLEAAVVKLAIADVSKTLKCSLFFFALVKLKKNDSSPGFKVSIYFTFEQIVENKAWYIRNRVHCLATMHI